MLDIQKRFSERGRTLMTKNRKSRLLGGSEKSLTSGNDFRNVAVEMQFTTTYVLFFRLSYITPCETGSNGSCAGPANSLGCRLMLRRTRLLWLFAPHRS